MMTGFLSMLPMANLTNYETVVICCSLGNHGKHCSDLYEELGMDPL